MVSSPLAVIGATESTLYPSEVTSRRSLYLRGGSYVGALPLAFNVIDRHDVSLASSVLHWPHVDRARKLDDPSLAQRLRAIGYRRVDLRLCSPDEH